MSLSDLTISMNIFGSNYEDHSRRTYKTRMNPSGESGRLAPLARKRTSPPREVAQAARVAPAACRRAPPVPPAPSPRKSRSAAERLAAASVLRPPPAPAAATSSRRTRSARERIRKFEDVIDLGAPSLSFIEQCASPRGARTTYCRASYAPNPRLYPGPGRARPRAPLQQVPCGAGEARGRRRKRASRRAAPSPRLYRPAPRSAPSAAAAPRRVPRAAWAPPAPPARLDTASRAALRLSEQRRVPPGRPPVSAAVTHIYKPASAHFKLRCLNTESGGSTPVAGWLDPSPHVPTMDAGNRTSSTPEDCSDGNETLSAPSEFLAEFLSSIMRRQYTEALKYCRLILQYEPHNATARGFYPLLQQKVQAQKRPDGEYARGSSSDETSAPADAPHVATAASPAPGHERMEQGGDSSDGEGGASRSLSPAGDSCRSQSSLELDSSEAPGQSSPSLERTERTDSASAGGAWGSSASASRSDTDDNGNATFPSVVPCAGDLQNDNTVDHKGLSALQRLRAQFTCSIK